jgi:hypothetical protein
MTEQHTTTLANKPTYVPMAIEKITTPAGYTLTAERLKLVKAFQKSVEQFFEPHKQRARAAWQGLVDEEKKLLQPAQEDEKKLKAELVVYDTAQEQLRLAEERRLQEEARQREEQRRLDEAAAMEREATRLGDADLQRQAEELVNEPVETPAVQLASYVPKVGGLSYRTTYSGKVVDPKKLIKFIAKNLQYLNLVNWNQTAINQLARAQRENLKIDGLQVVTDKTPTSGS